MMFIKIKTSAILIASTLMLSATQSYATDEKARSAVEQTLTKSSEKYQQPDTHLRNVCHELQDEINTIRSCNSASECGQVLTGTSCGCTRDLVARNNVDLTKFQRLKKEYEALMSVSTESPSECSSIRFMTVCDCPNTDGFACENHLCTWNYRNVEPRGGAVKPHTPETLSPKYK